MEDVATFKLSLQKSNQVMLQLMSSSKLGAQRVEQISSKVPGPLGDLLKKYADVFMEPKQLPPPR